MRVARRSLGAQPQDMVRIDARSVPAACGGGPAIRGGGGRGEGRGDGRRIDGNLWQQARAVAGQATVLSRGSVVAQGARAVIRADFGLIGAAYLGGTPEVAGGADF